MQKNNIQAEFEKFFLQASCSFSYPINSVKAMKGLKALIPSELKLSTPTPVLFSP